MPLGTNLANDIQAVLEGDNSLEVGCALLAQAYFDYTAGALFGASIPVLTEDYRDIMATALEAALGVIPGVAATAAAAYALAVNAYWTGVVVAGGAGVGVSTGCPGAGALVGALTAVFSNPANTHASAASGIASALQTATATVIVNLTLPPAGPVPTPIG